MKFEYEIDAEKGFIVERFRGSVYLQDICDAMEQLEGDSRYNPHFNGMVDLRDAVLELRFPDTMRIKDHYEKEPRASVGRWVFIVQGQNNFGTMRMYKSVTDDLPVEVNIVESEEEALAWRASLK